MRSEAGGFFGNAAPSPVGVDSYAVVQYIGSRDIIDDVSKSLDLRAMFSRPEADWPARLRLPTTIEELVRYWKGQVDGFFDVTNGTVTVKARAFTPEDALNLAQAILSSSERLVNELSARARRDTSAEFGEGGAPRRAAAQDSSRASARVPRPRGHYRSAQNRRRHLGARRPHPRRGGPRRNRARDHQALHAGRCPVGQNAGGPDTVAADPAPLGGKRGDRYGKVALRSSVASDGLVRTARERAKFRRESLSARAWKRSTDRA